MTPMIDVVFLLIIFFLVSSHLVRQESQLELPLPVAESGAEDLDVQRPRVTVNIKEDGTHWIAGRPVAVEELIPRLTGFREEKGEDVEVRIRSSRAAPYSSAEPVMLACTKSGIWSITYAVYAPEDRQ